jgi:predicted Zn-dependent protease
MKRWMALAGIVLLGAAAIVVSERRKVEVAPGPAPMLYLIADTEQEITRMPVSFTRMSDAEEIAAGNSLARYYFNREEKPNPEKREIEAYLNQVGARLAAHAHRKLPYRFHYLPDRYFINAFALPGGHVFIGEGMLRLMDSEDELASVLGHEIEHVDHYHCAERVQQQQALRKIPLGSLFAIPVEVFEAGYSKDQELEADREGTRLAVEAGYSPNGAIRMFETFQRLYEEYRSHAKTPQEELTQVAGDTLEGYFRSHPLASERIAQLQRLISDEHWPVRAERDLEVGYIFWSAMAAEALDAGEYPKAQQLASQSLKLRPDQPKALATLARAQFVQADFSRAAETYRTFLDLGYADSPAATAYAQSLAFSDRQNAGANYQKWMDSFKGEKARALLVPLAGLKLLKGDSSLAKTLTVEANAAENLNSTDWAPNWLADLAWWYYLAGDYETAHSVLESAVQQRPGNARFAAEMGWIDIERHHLADALQELGTVYPGPDHPTDFDMANAVTLWQANRKDEALLMFDRASVHRPEWESPRWIEALYGPSVAPAVEQMRQEQKRRQNAAQLNRGRT